MTKQYFLFFMFYFSKIFDNQAFKILKPFVADTEILLLGEKNYTQRIKVSCMRISLRNIIFYSKIYQCFMKCLGENVNVVWNTGSYPNI